MQFASNSPIHLMECPVAVACPEVGAPPIEDRIQLLDHHSDLLVGRKRSHHFAHPLTDIAARLLAWPHAQHPAGGLSKLEAKERESFCQRCQPTLLLIDHQSKSCELCLQSV